MVSLSLIQVIIIACIGTVAILGAITGFYSSIRVGLHPPLVHLDSANDVVGRLSIDQVAPDTTLPGCVFSNGTHYFTDDCADTTALLNLTNSSQFLGALTVGDGGTGGVTFSAGILKTTGGNTSFYSEGTINLVTEVSNVLAATHGGLGTGALSPGFLKSPGVGLTIVSSGATIDLVTEVSNTLTVPHGGSGGSTFSSGFLKSPGGAAAFTTSSLINVATEVTGTLGPTHGGLGHATFTQGYIFATGADDFISTLPIPSNHIASTLADKTLSGVTLLPDATSDALLYVSSGGFLSGVRYLFTDGDFILTPSGTNPVIIQVALNYSGDVSSVAGGGTGVNSFTAGFVKSPGGTAALTTVSTINLASEVSSVLDVSHGGTGLSSLTTGSILYASGTTTLVTLAAASTGNVLLSGSVPSWGKVDLTASVTGILPVANGGTGFATYAIGDLLYAATTSTLAKLSDVATGNVLLSGGVSTAPAYGKVDLTVHVTGVLPVANGGTGISNTYTIGDLLYASASNTLSKLADVATGNVLISGGVGTAPSWGKVGLSTHTSGTLDLTTQVTGVLPVANGGTHISSYTVGAILYASTSSVLSQLADIATGNVLLSGGVTTAPSYGKVDLTAHVTGILPAVNGGTGQSTYVIGDILYASTTSALSKLTAVATGNALISGGTSTAPSWGKITLTSHVSGILPAANGGTGFGTATPYTIGDILYASTTTVLSALADAATGNAIISGGVGVAPSYGKIGLTTHVSGILPAANGGTGFGTATPYVVGDILYASTTTALSTLSDVATGSALISGGVGVAPSYGKIALTTHISGILPVVNGGTNIASYTVGAILYASTSGILSQLTDVATGNVLISGGLVTAPSYGKVDLAVHVTGILPAVNGGTGQSTYAVGDLLYASTTSALSRVATAVAGNVLHSNGAASPTWSQVVLTTDVSGLLPSANGGTGFGTGNLYAIGDMLYASSTTTLSKITTAAAGNVLHCNGAGAPSWTAVSLTADVSGVLPVANGGTNIASYTIGAILYASGTTTIAQLVDVATGNVLISGGTTTAPSYGKVDLTVHVTGILPVANGGTNIASYAIGDILYASGSTTLSKLADVATGNVLLSGGVTTAPSYGKVDLTAHITGVLPVANGGTNIGSYTVGAILYASTSGVLSQLVDVATGNVLISGGTSTAPSYGKVDLTAHVTSTLPTANGGTGQTTYTDGQLLIGSTSGGSLTKATLTAGSGITITNGGGSITIASSGGTNTEYTTAGSFTYTIPSGAKYLLVTLCGSGGGGGSGASSSVFAGAGAGGAGICRFERIPVDSDTTAAVVIGAAGIGAVTAGGNGGAGNPTTITLGSRAVNAQPGGGGAFGNAAGAAGAGGGSAGSQAGGSATSNSATGTAGGSTASGFLGIGVGGQLGGSAGNAGVGPTAASRLALYLIGGGGGGGSLVSANSGAGGVSHSGYASGSGFTGTASRGAGGGGGSSGLAAGGNGCDPNTSTLAVAGTKGSGGGGGCGGTGSTWSAGANGGAGYMHIQAVF
jgi:hypothetical protein